MHIKTSYVCKIAKTNIFAKYVWKNKVNLSALFEYSDSKQFHPTVHQEIDMKRERERDLVQTVKQGTETFLS
jgi:hypothetical protein